MKNCVPIVLAIAVLAPLRAQSDTVLRMAPSQFPQLPAAIIHELEKRRCTIPQAGMIDTPHNVIQGNFAKPGQTDWAVLCSIEGVSSILVFWNGSAANPASIASMPDSNFLQGRDSNPQNLVFSRRIAPVGKDFIDSHYQAYGGPQPPPIDHQGIDDAFMWKASVVNYLYGAKWLELSGSD